jgi:Retrotransposon gag protein
MTEGTEYDGTAMPLPSAKKADLWLYIQKIEKKKQNELDKGDMEHQNLGLLQKSLEKLVSVYSGDNHEEIQDFISKVDLFFGTVSFTNQARQLFVRSKLIRTARIWAEEIRKNSKNLSWEMYSARMLARFSNPDQERQELAKLEHHKFEADGSKYINEFEKVLSRVGMRAHNYDVNSFLRGLPEYIQKNL